MPVGPRNSQYYSRVRNFSIIYLLTLKQNIRISKTTFKKYLVEIQKSFLNSSTISHAFTSLNRFSEAQKIVYTPRVSYFQRDPHLIIPSWLLGRFLASIPNFINPLSPDVKI